MLPDPTGPFKIVQIDLIELPKAPKDLCKSLGDLIPQVPLFATPEIAEGVFQILNP